MDLLVAFKNDAAGHNMAKHISQNMEKDGDMYRGKNFDLIEIDTPAIASHLLENPNNALTPIGKFLRKYSIDEFPQLWSIMIGDMSFVGPRPALFNQKDLIQLRTKNGVDKLLPGLTGWAQIHGRDELPIPEKVKMDL